MFSVVRHIVRKEFLQLFRDRRMLIPLFLGPVIQLVLFGFAATIDVKNISLAVVDQDRTEDSRALVSAFTQSGYFTVRENPESPTALDVLLQTGRVRSALVFPADFSRRLGRMEAAPLQVLIDGADANSATIIQSYVLLIAAKYSAGVAGRALGGAFEPVSMIEPRVWYNPELKSSVWMVPGVISMILLLTTLILTAMAVTREREIGTYEQLIVSPIRPVELILGKTVPFVIIGFADVVLVLLAGRLVFHVPMRGSLPFLFGAAFIFLLTTLGTGLLISTISRTQSQAMMSAMFFVMPAMLLSGVFSPIKGMPRLVQYLTYLNPLGYFGKIVRAILLKGSGPDVLWPELAALAAIGLAVFTLSALRFRKRLE
ncbi:MAG: ABC transporter permease [Candidatus Aminicenantes bacterium]|nr:ABC transporter permease [Candidatus Aminicenantes bacterium]